MKNLIAIFTIALLSLTALKSNAQGIQRNTVEDLENPASGNITGPTELIVNETGDYIIQRNGGCFDLYNYPPCESFIVEETEHTVKVNAGPIPGVFQIRWAMGCELVIEALIVNVESNIDPVPILGPVHLKVNETAHYSQAGGVPSPQWNIVNVPPCDASITYSDSLTADVNSGTTPGQFTLYCNGTPLINGSLDVFVHEDFPVTVKGSILQDYPDLTKAFEAINGGVHGNGAITVLINGSHTLTSTATLNGGVFASCEIKPTANVTVTGNFDAPLIILDGADNVTIDGRVGQTENASLTLTGLNDEVRMKNGASDNIVKYVNFFTWNYYCIIISQSDPGTGGNNNISIEDCNINGVVYSRGTSGSSGYPNAGINILRNTCFRIELLLETKNVEIKNNRIYAIVLNSVGKINVTGNKSGSIDLHPTDLTSPDTGNTEINVINNFFSAYTEYICGGLECYFDIRVFDFSTQNVSGITANIKYNTIALNGYAWSFHGWEYYRQCGCRIEANTGNIIFRNNIVEDNLNHGRIGTTIIANTGANIDADYNCYNGGIWNFSGYSLSEYKAAAYPNEQHTIFKNLNYANVTTGDLHLAGASVSDADLMGIQIPGIPTDIDGELRNSPFMGADETDYLLTVSGKLKLGISIQGQSTISRTQNISMDSNDSINSPGYVTVFLRNASAPFAIVDSASAILDPETHYANFVFRNNAAAGGPYYIQLNHKNSLETWSSSPLAFTGDSLVYDFTTSSSQAYGNNLILTEGKWCVYSGDVNQDGSIDLTDLLQIFNDATNFVTGNAITDLNGDEIVDLTDLNLVNNNSGNFVSVKKP